MARKRLGYTGVCMVGLFHTAYVRIRQKACLRWDARASNGSLGGKIDAAYLEHPRPSFRCCSGFDPPPPTCAATNFSSCRRMPCCCSGV